MLRAKSTKLEGSVENGYNNDGILLNNSKNKNWNKTIKSSISNKSITAPSSPKTQNPSRGDASPIDGKKRPLLRPSKTVLSMDLCKSDTKLNSSRSMGARGVKKPADGSTKPNTLNSFANHKRGEIPKYLQKAKSAGLSSIDLSLINGNKKTFTSVKSRLAEVQTEFIKTFTTIKELEKKHSKSLVPLEDYKLIVCVEGDEGKLVLKTDMKTPPFSLRKNLDEKCMNIDKSEQLKSFEKNEDSDIKLLNEKLCSVLEGYFKTCQEIIKHPEGQMGDSIGIESVESKLIKSIEDRVSLESSKMNENITKILEDFDHIYQENKKLSEVNDQRIEYECKICELNTQIEECNAKIDILEKQAIKRSESNEKTKELQNKLQEMQNKVTEKERELSRYKACEKRHEEQRAKLTKESKLLNEEISHNSTRLASVERELQHYKNSSVKSEQLMKELTTQKESFCSLLQVEKDLRQRVEEETSLARQLRSQLQIKEEELASTLTTLESQKVALLASGDKQQAVLAKEIKTLQKQIENLETSNSQLESENEELKETLDLGQAEELKNQLEISFKEIQLLKTTNLTLCERIAVMDDRLQERNTIIEELEEKISNPEFIQSCTNEVYDEIRKLRNSEAEKMREINKLKLDLSKCNLDLKQHEETNFTNKRLLKIRSDLIDSIQEKEASTNCRIEELYTEVVHKDGIISHINHELNAKSEEMANLLSTLNQKTQELTRQEHTTLMLKENVIINQKMRERQVERIQALEEHIIDLKDSLEVYRNTVLSGNRTVNVESINENIIEYTTKDISSLNNKQPIIE